MYPLVISEEETLARVSAGASIARFGDGELKIMCGRDCVSQDWNGRLQQELQNICNGLGYHTNLLVGIPTIDERSPRQANWQKLTAKFERWTRTDQVYGSAFITRPDSAPWIDTAKYFDQVEALWRDQTVILVGNGKRSITQEFLLETGAKRVYWVQSSYKNSYTDIDDLEQEILAMDTKRVLLCVGPTATCLAARLAFHGRHAIDLGHIGMFWRRYATVER
jgi:hypothetical protein